MKTAWGTVLAIAALCAVIVAAFTPNTACADSWAMPETEITLSENGQFRFTVEPAPIGSQIEYFGEEALAARDGTEVERPSAFGLLERRNADGGWEPVWGTALVNAVAPVTAKVSDDGRFVITFDNWHSVGLGENVIVIYGEDGKLVRSMALTDLVPQEYMDALSRSISSVWWKRGDSFSADDTVLEVDVLIPGADRDADPAPAVTFQITLEDGKVTLPPEDKWQAAQCAADDVNEQRERAEQERLAYLREPLRAPRGCDMGDWHTYLNEAHMRLTPEPLYASHTSTTILFPANHPRHAESVGWLRDRLDDEWGYPRYEAFASPCDPAALVAAVGRIAAGTEPGAWPDATFYVAAPGDTFEKIRRLLAPTGATLVWLDPEASIPQKPERIPGSVEEEAAKAEAMQREMAEIEEMLGQQ